jgi:predicted TIM-barrel fold metal-dependent hydrolase
MQRKIGLEEHFAIPETLSDSRGCLPDETWTELRERVLDIHDRRLREMDQHGVEMMILSLNAPAIQAIPDPSRADEIARKANDYLAEQVHRVLDDWPFENVSHAAAWFDTVPISEADRLKIGRTNALKLFRMPDA